MTTPILLNDEQVQSFIVDGLLIFPSGIDEAIDKDIHTLLQYSSKHEGQLGNNVASRIPQMHDVLRAPAVAGALTSLLGHNYLVHPHRAVHKSTPIEIPLDDFTLTTDEHRVGEGSTATSSWHQDAQSPLARARHHMPKYLIGFYFPHDVTAAMGPTRFKKASYMYPKVSDMRNVIQPDMVDAGTFMLCHFDTIHAGFPNQASTDRFLVKFVFARTEYPISPSWNHHDPVWRTPLAATHHDDLTPAWTSVWRWLLGTPHAEGNQRDATATKSEPDAPPESRRIIELYGPAGPDEPRQLIAALLNKIDEPMHERVAFVSHNPKLDASDTIRDLAYRWNEQAVAMEDETYRLATLGDAAIEPLLELLDSANLWLKLNAIFALGEIECTPPRVVEALLVQLDNPHHQVVRQTLDALACKAPQLTDDCFNAIAELAATTHDEWLNPLTLRGWNAQDQIRMNAALVLLNAVSAEKSSAQIETIAVKLLSDANGYAASIAAETLVRMNSATALQAALQYYSDRRWDDTLRVDHKRY